MSLTQRTNLYDCLCAALRKPLSEGGHLALTAALNNLAGDDIAVVLDLMTNDEALAIFNWLDDRRAKRMLTGLRPDQVNYLLRHAPAGRICKMSELQ
jgi:Mg/Co/Ni transporter MgtE